MIKQIETDPLCDTGIPARHTRFIAQRVGSRGAEIAPVVANGHRVYLNGAA